MSQPMHHTPPISGQPVSRKKAVTSCTQEKIIHAGVPGCCFSQAMKFTFV